MISFNEYISKRYLTESDYPNIERLKRPKVELRYNGQDIQLDFDSAETDDNLQIAKPRVVTIDKNFWQEIIKLVPEKELSYFQKGFPVRSHGDKLIKFIKDNIKRSELGWSSVARFYGLAKPLPTWSGDKTYQ